jgi:hypothetical protein
VKIQTGPAPSRNAAISGGIGSAGGKPAIVRLSSVVDKPAP